jgi:hypothetical protein
MKLDAGDASGRENAEKRGLSGRVSFIEGPATDHASPADVDASCGAYQAFGTVFEAHRRAQPNPALTKS